MLKCYAKNSDMYLIEWTLSLPQIAKFMGPTWDPPGSCRPQMGPMLASWTFLSGTLPFMVVLLTATPCLGKDLRTNGYGKTWIRLSNYVNTSVNVPITDWNYVILMNKSLWIWNLRGLDKLPDDVIFDVTKANRSLSFLLSRVSTGWILVSHIHSNTTAVF